VYDPVLGEAYRRMGLHYGFLISPTGPADPNTKAKSKVACTMSNETLWPVSTLLTAWPRINT